MNEIRNNNISRKILLLGSKFLSLINVIIPKNENKILFYDSGRSFLDDNTEAIYTYLYNNGYAKKYKMICCVPNQKLDSPFRNYTPVGALKGVFAFLTSKYVFYSFGDFRIVPSSKQIVVNQWHGMPLKRIGKYADDEKYQKENLDNFTYILATSELFKPVMAKAFGSSTDKVAILGETRVDYFFSDVDALSPFGIEREMYDKLVIWMPTFRQSIDGRFQDGDKKSSTLLPVFYTYESLDALDDFLEKNNILLVIKIHPMAVFKEHDFKRIIIMTNNDIVRKGIRPYEFLKEFDALITDYSSVYVDYLILNRPIVFTMDDEEEYKSSRGFIFDDIKALMPGPFIKTEEEFKQCLKDILQGHDSYSDKRIEINKQMNLYQKDHCKRLADFVGLSI